METKTIGRFTFENECHGCRYGFYHRSKLLENGEVLGKAKCEYLNRTWEAYRYQTVMKKAVRKAIEKSTNVSLLVELNDLLTKLGE